MTGDEKLRELGEAVNQAIEAMEHAREPSSREIRQFIHCAKAYLDAIDEALSHDRR